MANLNLTQTSTGLIGGLGMTRVNVYNQRIAPDGKLSGCPHVHAICAEAYYVLQGEGYVEIHTLDEGLKTVHLKPGSYFQFPPRALHRLVSEADLAVLGLMSNSGLAENGDARIYFGPEVDADPDQYHTLVKLTSKGLEGALERRDHSVRAYIKLMQLWEDDQSAYFEELSRFIELHQTNVLSESSKFTPYVQNGPAAWGAHTSSLLNGEPSGFEGDQFIFHEYSQEPRLGMCGTLHTVQTDGGNCSPDA